MSICCRFIGPAAEQDDQRFAVFAEVDPVSRAEIESQFHDAGSYALCRGATPLQPHGDPRLGNIVELPKPPLERITAVPVDILQYLDHRYIVA